MKRIWKFVMLPAYCATFVKAKQIARHLPYARQVKLLRALSISSEAMFFSGEEGDDGLVMDGCGWTLHCPDGSQSEGLQPMQSKGQKST